MNKPAMILAALVTASASAFGQNPLVNSNFTADPTARVFNGRVYVYPSHDIPPATPDLIARKWFCMGDYHVYSSANMTDWTDHGVILDQKDVPWGDPEAYSMWAPDCVEKDGKYYFFFPNAPKAKEGERRGGFGIGVAVADNPYGPFIAREKNIEGIGGIDPCVLHDDDGKWYIYWGGGGLMCAQLNDDFTGLHPDTPVREREFMGRTMKFVGVDVSAGLPEGFKEGPFVFKRGGKYYLTYPWVRGKAGEPGWDGKPTDNHTETLAYAMSDSPMGPFEFKGLIMNESPTGCWTNHHSIVQFKDTWYLFYHHNDYSPKFDKNRSMCCDTLRFNPDGTIQTVVPTRRGVGVTDALGLIQIDRYNTASQGVTIEYNDSVHPFNGWKVRLAPNAWIKYGNVKNAECGMQNVEYKGKVWVAVPGFFGRMQVQTIDKTTLKLDVKPLPNGLSELTLTNTGDRPVEVDWISLNPRQPLTPASRGGLETGSYRNLFLEAGYTQEEIGKKLQSVFNDVFFGKNRCYFEKGDMGYISDIKNDDVRTEGMSYGMMIAVQMNRKDIFDRLWRWTKRYMLMDEGTYKGYFRWTCKRDGTPNANGPASDGELYFITSLIFASNQWGNDTGINYLAEAQSILNAIQPREAEFEMRWGKDRKPLEKPIKEKRTIALIDPASQLISFVPGMPFTDPSYHIPAFYEVWARYADDGRASYWRECARKSREYLHKSVHPFTGLNPDNNNFDGTPLNHGFGFGDAFRYDSWRVPMNIALDYSWSCADRDWQQDYGKKFQNFLYSQGINDFLDQYNVDGTTPEKLLRAGNYPEKLRHSIGLVATAAAASILCDHPKAYEFIDKLWNAKHTPDKDGYFDAYYDGLLRLFAFMHLSGRYRVIEKQMLLPSYLKPVDAKVALAQTDEQGFIGRWMLLEPIDKPNRSNTVFVDSYLREAFKTVPVGAAGTKVPREGQKEKIGKQTLTWHGYDSNLYNVKLYRLASCQGLQRYGVLFWAVTVIDCDEEIRDVRLSVGSNSASMWWLNGEEAVILSGDRRMVKDDCLSPRLTLRKGRNILRGAIINGPGMSDFCVRFLDEQGQPVKNLRVSSK